MLRNYNPLLGVDVVDKLSLVDYGDVPTVPGSTVDSLERSAAALEEVARAGVTTLCLGGDHTVLLAELRALAAGARSARRWSSSTRTTTCGTSTSGRSSSTGASSAARSRRA